jgi:uncharacterized protein
VTPSSDAWRAPADAVGWYLDASALVKLYLPEPETTALERALEGRADLVTSDLSITETVGAWARRRREQALSAQDLATLHRRIRRDRDEGPYGLIHSSADAHRSAEGLLIMLSSVPLRASDALHVAHALSAGASVMVTFDRHLSRAAQAAGLAAIPRDV